MAKSFMNTKRPHKKKNILSFYFFAILICNIYIFLIYFKLKYIRCELLKLRVNDKNILTDVQVSIVIPIFNRLLLINRSLSSAQNQMLPNIEIICVDDCSTEPTSEFIIERMKSDKRIKFVQHFYRQGNFHGRKNGVLTSKGQYIVSLDSDDSLYPNSINQVYEYAIKMNADVVDYIASNIFSSNKTIDNWRPCKENFTTNEQLKLQYYKKQLSYNIWKRFVKRSIYLKAIEFIYPFIKGKKLSKTEDVMTLGSIFLFASNMYCTNFRVYIHYMFSPLSVEKGFSQPYRQNRIQTKFTEKAIRYLYFIKKSNFKDASLEEMLRIRQISTLYNKITDIKTDVVEKNCELKIDGFVHYDVLKYGYCVIVKK